MRVRNDSLGQKQIAFLFSHGWVEEPPDIITSEARDARIQLQAYEGYGLALVRKLFRAIPARRETSLECFIYALGILDVGETTTHLLSHGYASWRAFQDACGALTNASTSAGHRMDARDGIGSVVINSLTQYFREPDNNCLVDRLTAQVHIRAVEHPTRKGPLVGKTIVFTSKLEHMTRHAAESVAERLGANPARSVSKQTDYVIAGSGAGTKREHAQAFGITILPEDRRRTLIEEHSD